MVTLQNILKKSYYYKKPLIDCMLAFINPFSLVEQNIIKIPSDVQMNLIDLELSTEN